MRMAVRRTKPMANLEERDTAMIYMSSRFYV